MFRDLREFIAKCQELGEYKVIEGADWEKEIGVLTEIMASGGNSPLLVFDKVKGYPRGYRVASNLFSSPRRIALGLGLPLNVTGIDLVKALRDKVRAGIKPIPPVTVDSGPVMENVHTGEEVDLFEFPTPRWHELDGGRYIGTGSMGITRDPDEGWVNVGCYRVQIHDKTTATIWMAPSHHGNIIARKYWTKGVGCPVAVTCGQDPTLWAGSNWEPVPWGVCEYDFAGGLKQEPIEVIKRVTTGLPIPATAEIVLEGEIVPPEVETRVEGPFGEWAGYYAAGKREIPAFRVKAILHRNNPIIQGNPSSFLPSVWTLGRHIQKAAVLWAELDRQGIPGIKGVWMIEEAAIHSIPVISIEQKYEGHAKQAALIAAGCAATGHQVRFIVVVDEDIDPSNNADVLWALGTRTDPESAIDIIRGLRGDESNPIISPEKKSWGDVGHAAAIILACKPYHWIKQFPRSIKTSPEVVRQVKEKWSSIL